MTTTRLRPTEAVLRPLGPDDASALADLARAGELRTLSDDTRRAGLLASARVFGAFVADHLVGTCAVVVDSDRSYVDARGGVRTLPVPNGYLCAALVRPDLRGCGVGTRLYRARLAAARTLTSGPLAIEILGIGAPGSVAAGARTGLNFHRRAGFHVVGHSLEDDHGPLLMIGGAS